MTDRRGPHPHFWKWACHGACHWLVNHNLIVISQLEPDRNWQISSSDIHSTVVDIDRQLLFDPSWIAMSIDAEECWDNAVDHDSAELLPPGELRLHY